MVMSLLKQGMEKEVCGGFGFAEEADTAELPVCLCCSQRQ
jgi:hypothetical protein